MKVKNKNKNLSDSLRKKVSTQKKALNPFELHINRQKFQVLGRKQKYEQGLPGVAKARSIKKRKETLLQEYKVKDKTNRFVDRRIGENNSAMTAEDKLMARFTAERVRAHNKKMIFNLAEDEILTHRGQTLSEIEKFDDPRSDDEDDDEDGFSVKSGRLNAQFVEEAHFGGGMLKKGEEGHKSRATLIDELIAESKKRKVERQQAKEKTLQLTEKLDADWKDLLPLAFAGNKKEEDDKPQKESYDIVMRELKFEARGIPSNKLKSESEIAKEEKEQLEKLEEERLKRMKGIEKSESTVINHRSADDLDDGFDLKNDLDDNLDNINEEAEENGEEMSGSEDSDEDNEEVDSNTEEKVGSEITEIKEKDVENSDTEDKNDDDDDEGEEEEDDDDDDDDNDSLSDLKGEFQEESDDSETELQNNETSTDKQIKSEKSVSKHKKENKMLLNKNIDSSQNESKIDVDKFKEELLEKKRLMEEARKELPYTFKVPESYEELQQLLSGRSAETQSVIIERMIKCNHPSLGSDNKDKLATLFAFLLQILNDAEYNDCWRLLDRLSPHLFDLTQFSPDNSAHCISEVLKEKQADFTAHPQRYPPPDTLIFLQLIALLFPTSDARHQITTPAMVFLCQMLFQCKVITPRDISTGLLVTTIVSQYISLSKRYCGEAVSFLRGCLNMAIPKDVEVENILPFKPGHRLLVLSQSQNALKDIADDLRMKCSDLSAGSVCDDKFRLRCINTSVQLLTQFAKDYEPLSASPIIFKPCLLTVQKLPVSYYPERVRQNVQTLQDLLVTLTKKKLQYVMLEKKKPKALKMYEPDIQKVYDGKRHKDLPEEKLEQQKLLHKYKREMKGALREVRRDKSFLAKIKFRNQAKSDEERMQRVKQIYSWGANQEGELRKLKRKKS